VTVPQRGQHRKIVVVFGVVALTWIAVPVVVGLISGNLLLAGVCFAVWISLTAVTLGIWVSSSTVDHSRVTRSAAVSPEGWVLPAGVTKRSSVPKALLRCLTDEGSPRLGWSSHLLYWA
jgi:hypothetical protein